MDWKKSKAHLLLLSKFLRANSFDDFARHEFWRKSWENALGEPPIKALNRFEKEKMLKPADLSDLILHKYKVIELKQLLKQRSLPISGNSDELAQRLMQADPNGMKTATAELKLLICTERGHEIAEQYLVAEKEKCAKVEFQVMEYITKRKFKEASLMVASYEAEQVFSRGIGLDRKKYNSNKDIQLIKTIFESKPRNIIQLENEKLETLQIVAAMAALWGTNMVKKYLPVDFETGLPFSNEAVVRNIQFYAHTKAELLDLKQQGLYKRVRVISSKDNRTCQECANLNGKVFTIDEALEKMPLPNLCTSEEGWCRCTYTYER